MNVLSPGGPQAQNIAGLVWAFIGVCGVVYLATLTMLVWALLRSPRGDDDSPRVSYW
jgi:hypothetical protein